MPAVVSPFRGTMIAPARLVSTDHMPFDTNPLDAAVRSWIVAHQVPAGVEIAAFVSKVASPGRVRWAGMLAAVFLFAMQRRRGSIAVAAAPWLALAAYSGIRRIFPRGRPPGIAGYHEAASSFPSAHATTSSAVFCTLAYVLWREQMLGSPAALALAIVPPICIGLSRIYLDVHWSTDVLGGWCAGLVVTAVSVTISRLWPTRDER